MRRHRLQSPRVDMQLFIPHERSPPRRTCRCVASILKTNKLHFSSPRIHPLQGVGGEGARFKHKKEEQHPLSRSPSPKTPLNP